MSPTRIFAATTPLYLTACLIAGITLAERSLHLPRLPLGDSSVFRARMKQQFHADVQNITLPASDGALLKAWFIQPFRSNGESVILLHGMTANRAASSGFAEMFLRRGYGVLLPDSRAHGESGGDIATYGIFERDDTRLWVRWLRTQDAGCTYLLGESMGAAIGLQATAVAPSLCAVAVEAPYADFRSLAYERVGQATHLPPLFWRTLGRPVIEIAIAYTRLRYGIWLPDASPIRAVASASTPALLIAGTADRNIPMHHARELGCIDISLQVYP
jgi:fermentation-respiration switch protein FrsA (DUF1100 family)